jgi:hypothetical protein
MNKLVEQPRLRFWLAEYLGRAKTVTDNFWWYEERDGVEITRIPLIPIEPIAAAPDPLGEDDG